MVNPLEHDCPTASQLSDVMFCLHFCWENEMSIQQWIFYFKGYILRWNYGKRQEGNIVYSSHLNEIRIAFIFMLDCCKLTTKPVW